MIMIRRGGRVKTESVMLTSTMMAKIIIIILMKCRKKT